MCKPTTYVENLGLLEPENRLFLCTLPTNSRSIVVNLTGSTVRISCLIPSQKLTIQFDKYDGNIKTHVIKIPNLLISLRYCDIPNKTVAIDSTRIYAINTNIQDRIIATPYLLSNVSNNGEICWGGLKIPANLRVMFNTYWGSVFNNDLTQKQKYSKHIKKYYKKILNKQKYVDITEEICGKKYWASPRRAEAVLVTNNFSLLKQIPNKCWRKSNFLPYIIASGNLIDDNWVFEISDVKFSVSNNNITTKRYPSYGYY